MQKPADTVMSTLVTDIALFFWIYPVMYLRSTKILYIASLGHSYSYIP
uniref:Uncharacterized protein n=1 Tax=Anguilla anguilla TaxID=7936 RepID=A0A0E9PTX0_ANGAN